MADEEDIEVEDHSSVKCAIKPSRPSRKANKAATLKQIILKNERNALVRRVSNILRKAHSDRTKEDVDVLTSSPELADRLKKQAIKRDVVKLRTQEIEDPSDVIEEKCKQLAEAIKNSDNVVIYTGAGISTAASIPDYRGPNGVWTLLQKGQQPEAQDLSDAEPTLTHMCISKLYTEGHVKYVVSQNCDGLHLRSGLPRKILSEVHGNMYLEICSNCKPQRDYVRLFDVTEKTGVRRHSTDRNCHMCGKKLRDTIVHFGEKGGLKSPYKWKQAARAANNCDIILCLGTSLKILKKYSCLWCMDRRLNKRPDLYIVNLQWTPKDDVATLKINGRCDDVMKQVLEYLQFSTPVYKREEDPIFTMAVPLRPSESNTTTKKILSAPKHVRKRKHKIYPSAHEPYQTKQQSQDKVVKFQIGSGDTTEEGTESYENKYEPNELLSRRLNGFSSTLSQIQTSQIKTPVQTSPLDLSRSSQSQVSNDFARSWSHDLFSVLCANQNLVMADQQHQNVCMICLTDRGNGQLCKCSRTNSLSSLPGYMMPTVNGLLPYQTHMQLMRHLYFQNPGFSLPFQGYFPFAPPVFQPQRFETVLRDHCYLNKHQMQQLSPKQTKPDEEKKSSKVCETAQKPKVKVETATSPIKPCNSLKDENDLRVKLETESDTHNTSSLCKLERSISQDDRPPEVLAESKCEEQNEESECSASKKPKLCRSISVPGWFGKGLNVRKKKKM